MKPSLVGAAPRNNSGQFTSQPDSENFDLNPLDGDLTDANGESAKSELRVETEGKRPQQDFKSKSKPQRDFTGIPEEFHSSLRAMSNEAFDTFKTKIPKWLEAETKAARVAELEARLSAPADEKGPKFFYEHPEAYQVAPEYTELQSKLKQVDVEEQFWKQQILSGRQTKTFRMPTGVDTQGNIVLHPETFDFTPETELELASIYNNIQNTRNELQKQRSGIQQNFTQQFQGAVNAVNQVCDQHFPWRKTNPELLNEVYDIPGLGKKSVKQMREDAVSILPTQFRNHPLAATVQDMFAAINILKSHLQESQAAQQVASAKSSERQSNLPKPTKASAQSDPTDRMFIDDINER